MRANNKSKKKTSSALNSAKRSNEKDVVPEKVSARDEIRTTVMEVIKKDKVGKEPQKKMDKRQQHHNDPVFQDIKKNDKRKVDPAEQYVKLNVKENARKNLVELQSSDDDIDQESPPTISPNSKVVSPIKKSGEESYGDDGDAHDDSNDVSTAKVAAAQKSNKKCSEDESNSENENEPTSEYEPRSEVESSFEGESDIEDVSSSDEEDRAPIQWNSFVPVKVDTKTDEREDDSNKVSPEPVSQKASNNKAEFKEYESEEEPKPFKAQPPVVNNKKKTKFEKDRCEEYEKTLKAYSTDGDNKAKPMSNMEKGWEKENDDNNDEIPAKDDSDSGPCEKQKILFSYNQPGHLNDQTGKEKSHISRAWTHEKEATAVPAAKPTSKMEVNDSSEKCADKRDEISVKGDKGPKRLIDLIFDNGGSKEKKYKKGINCFSCNQPGHMLKDCTNKSGGFSDTICFECDEIGHMSRECPKQKYFESGTRCFKCNKIGHKSKECPKQKSFKGGTKCYNCDEIGHMCRECPQQKSFEGGTRCYNCNEIGHVSRECRNQKSFEGGRRCYNCNEIGHMFRECLQQKSFEGRTRCYNCNEVGHMSRECRNQKSFEGGTRCYKCNEIGHIYRECPQQKDIEGGTKCYNCNEIGHMSRECPKQKSDGGRMIVSNYIMTGIMPREYPSKCEAQVGNNRRVEVDYSTINYLKANDVNYFDRQKTGHSLKDCPEKRNSYMKLSLSDQYKDWHDQNQIDFSTGKEKRYVSRHCPQEEQEDSTIPSVKRTFRRDRFESEYENHYGFKVKRSAKRFYDSVFNIDSGPSEKKYKSDVNCFICNQPGHTNNDCLTKSFGGRCDMLCFNCNVIGHKSGECPMKKLSLASHVLYNCDETGIMPKECQTKKFSESVMKCYNCNSIGHTYVECPSKAGVRDDLRRYIADNKRNEVGHSTEDWHLQKNVKCFGCREHSKTDCHDEPHKNTYHQNDRFKHIHCFNCKEMGHISRDCPQIKESVRGAGFGRGSGTDGYGKGRHCC